MHSLSYRQIHTSVVLSLNRESVTMYKNFSDISSKATKTLGFLRRNLAFAPRSTKEVAYKTLVRPKQVQQK